MKKFHVGDKVRISHLALFHAGQEATVISTSKVSHEDSELKRLVLYHDWVPVRIGKFYITAFPQHRLEKVTE